MAENEKALATIMVMTNIIISIVLGFLCGLGSERIAMKKMLRHVISASNWNVTVKLVVSVLVVQFLQSLLCKETEYEESILPASVLNHECFLEVDGTIDVGLLLQFMVRVISFSLGARFGSALQPVGLTGGIACGKSTVSNLLREGNDKSFYIIDVDSIAHDILDPYKMGKDSAYHKLIKAFGEKILESTENPDTTTANASIADKNNTDAADNINSANTIIGTAKIDRNKLGNIIFKDRAKRKILNSITHPLITKIMLKAIFRQTLRLRSSWKPTHSLICVDVPLLFEGGLPMRILFGLKLSVLCDPPTQLKRLHKRNPELTLQQCQERISSQMPLEKKIALSDLVIRNDGNISDLTSEVQKARNEIINRAKAWNVTVDQLIFWQGLIVASIPILLHISK